MKENVCQEEMTKEPLRTFVKETPHLSENSTIIISKPKESENGNLKRRRENFLKKAVEVHGNKYDYSKSNYINAHTDVIIQCSIHGEFSQSPTNHIDKKHECPICRGYYRTTSEFIKMAMQIHGDTYDYSLSDYHKYEEKLIIVCKLHGQFKQSPNKHLHGRGCPKCANNLKSTTDIFINRANKIHKHKYNYSLTNYSTNCEKILIKCHIHGVFEQTPLHHLRGQGCSKCSLDPTLNFQGFKRKEYFFPSGRKEIVQGYEPWTIDLLLFENISEHDLIISGINRPSINYNYNGSNKIYFPDAYISSSNTLVETKSTWTMQKQQEQNLCKISGSLSEGYNIRFIVWDKNKKLVSDITYIPPK